MKSKTEITVFDRGALLGARVGVKVAAVQIHFS